MNHILASDTARQLKAAGYPHPEFATGQFWYDDDNALTIRTGKNSLTYVVAPIYTGIKLDDCYAPTATEILKEINNAAVEISYNPILETYFCYLMDSDISIHHPNPAEAAAQMWLHLREKIIK